MNQQSTPLARPQSEHYPYNEMRLTTRLLRYWQECKGIRTMPEENDIDPDVLGSDWDHCFVIQARDIANVQDYNFTYLGEKIIRAYFDTSLDQFNQFLVGPNAKCMSDVFHQVITSGAPMYHEGEFCTLRGQTVLYRQCALPLGNENSGVMAIFGGMNYKIAD